MCCCARAFFSGVIVLAGGAYYLKAHGGEAGELPRFRGTAGGGSNIGRIVAGAFALRARSVIQLGILVLIATPVLRVAVSLVGFAIERDAKYVAITALVLALLLYSLLQGASG